MQSSPSVRPRAIVRVLAAACVCALLIPTGCGSDADSAGGSGGASQDAGFSPFGDSSSPFGDSGASGQQDGGTSGDAVVDSQQQADAPVADVAAVDTATGPLPGEFQAACSSADDCDSGFCIDTLDGKVCTKVCTACPQGWACAQVSVPGSSDVVSVCVPKAQALCLPCETDEQCGKLATGALCVTYAAESELQSVAFCGAACEGAADCPTGYECKQAEGQQGTSKQCVKAAGLCECGEKATETGVAGICKVTNTFGTCTGTRKCGATGLTACSATVAVAELCNGKDDDCDGDTDEQVVGVACETKNEFGACKGVSTCIANQLGCDAMQPAAEKCDGLDNNCDGVTDEGCDDDKDGFCGAGIEIVGLPAGCTGDVLTCNQSAQLPPWCAKGIGDCNDDPAKGGAAVHPAADETCSDAIDNDCDGATDTPGPATAEPTGCKVYYTDGDNDGVGAGKGACLCAATKEFNSSLNTDCDDKNNKISPAETEICGNGIDDNCNNDQNEDGSKNCIEFCADEDGDGFGAGTSKCYCEPKGKYNKQAGGDCDDAKKLINPAATEACDTVDNDCDGATDEADATGCQLWYVDGDKDGYGDKHKSACLCGKEDPYTTLQGGDCADDKITQNPGFQEVCHDSTDNDCDGKTDEEDAKLCVDIWLDEDGDGYGKIGSKKCLCDKDPKSHYTTLKGKDCDDSPATGKAVNPDGKEICDGIDNDCVDGIDGGCDVDQDGWCATGKTVIGKPSSCPKGGGDCNDDPKTGKDIHPTAKEVCNGTDDNCVSGTDEGCDDDGDGYCDKNMVTVGKPAVCQYGGGDCNDKDKNVRPNRSEMCNNIDDNCTGGTDEGCDDDNDGYCDKNMVRVGTPTTCKLGGNDCCDTDASAHPGQGNWYATTNKCGSYDFNCSGSSERQFTVNSAPHHICEGTLCTGKAECIAKPAGWDSTIPACGKSATWVYDYEWNGSISYPLVNTCKTKKTVQRTQYCH